MNDKKDFKKALLEQNGLQAGHLPEQRRKEIEMILERQLKWVRRMRWVTVTLWLLWALLTLIIAFGVMLMRREPGEIGPDWEVYLFLVWIALPPIAIVSTISWYVRWRSATSRELNARLERLEEKLDCLSGTP